MIDNLKDLEKLLKLCRKQGVTELSLGQVSIKLGDLPQEPGEQTQYQYEEAQLDPYANFPPGLLTPEQEAFYASGGIPSEDPFRKDRN